MNDTSNNNLKPCKACGQNISKKAKKCPSCGEDQRNFFMRHKFLTGLIVLIVLAVLFGSDDSNDTTDAPKSKGKSEEVVEDNDEDEDNDSEDEDVKSEFSIGEVISYRDFDLVFENPRELSGISDEQYFVLDATITSKTDNLKFFGDIQGVNKDNEIINTTIPFVSEDIGDPIETAWTKTLNKGQKVKGYVAFEKTIDHMEVRSNSFKNDVIKILLN